MQPIRNAFNRAAGIAAAAPRVSIFWLVLFAIVILDDSDRREDERRKKRNRPKPHCKPKRQSGPRPF